MRIVYVFVRGINDEVCAIHRQEVQHNYEKPIMILRNSCNYEFKDTLTKKECYNLKKLGEYSRSEF